MPQRRKTEGERVVKDAVRDLADALQTLTLSIEAYYRPPIGCHLRGDALQATADGVVEAANRVSGVIFDKTSGSKTTPDTPH